MEEVVIEAKDELLVTTILDVIGEDSNRPGLQGTPRRVVKMWKEIFRGYDESQKPKVTTFMNGEDGLTYDPMVIDEGNFYSHCEHHMVPFFGQYFFAYIPNKKIVGISKVARLVDYHCAKLQIQERLVKDILDDIEKEIEPLGCALIMKGTHLCKVMRGVKKEGEMVTSDLRGNFRKQEVRNEFLSFIKF
jgi:GTP cyclohydrolase IA